VILGVWQETWRKKTFDTLKHFRKKSNICKYKSSICYAAIG
jgi:hypothetical protein